MPAKRKADKVTDESPWSWEQFMCLESAQCTAATFFVTPQWPQGLAQFEEFIAFVASTARVQQDAVIASPVSSRATKVIVRAGSSGETPLVFVLGPPASEFRLQFRKGLFGKSNVTDLISGRSFSVAQSSLTLPPSPWGLAVLQG